MASWYRRFIPNFATLLAPLTALLKKNAKIVWTEKCNNAFKELTERLCMAPVLSCPDYKNGYPFYVQTDASDYGLGAVLTQTTSNGEQVICYLSRSLTKSERAYSATEKECLAVLWSIEKLRPYLEGIPFSVITDHHSLQWLHNLKEPTGRLARWAIRLQQYDSSIIHRKGKDHVVPDLLSRAVPVVSAVDLETTTLHSDIKDRLYKRLFQNVLNTPAKFPKFKIEDHNLYRYGFSTNPLVDDENWKQVIPKDMRRDIIEKAHKGLLAGYTGSAKTYYRVCRNYYWPGMKHDIVKYVKRCPICLAVKSDSRKQAGNMLSNPIPDRPWQHISTDIFGPLPRTSKGNCYVIAVVDTLTKFILLFPLKKATSQAITRIMEEHVYYLEYRKQFELIMEHNSAVRSFKS